MLREVGLFSLEKKRLWGDLPICTRRVSRRQSQALHSGARWGQQARANGTGKESFRLRIRKIFVTIRALKQWSRLLMSLWSLCAWRFSRPNWANSLDQPGLTLEVALLWAGVWSRDLQRSLQPKWLCSPYLGQCLEPKLKLFFPYFLVHGYKRMV